jgi:Tol biopolymer transport system component
LYTLANNSLQLLTPETNLFIRGPHFAPVRGDVQFFSTEALGNALNLWHVGLDGTGKARVPSALDGLPLNTPNPEQVLISWDATGQNAYFSLRDEQYRIQIYHFDAQQNTLKTILENDDIRYNNQLPLVSPDGKRLIFVSNRSGQYVFWVLETATGKLRQCSGTVSGLYLYTNGNSGWLSNTEFYATGITLAGSVGFYKMILP